MTKVTYPDRAWFKANFQQWSGLLNMKFVARAAHLMIDNENATEQASLTDAVNRMIDTTVAELEAECVPADIIARFKHDYGELRRDHVLNAVCDYAIAMAPAFRQTKQQTTRKRPLPGTPASSA